MKSTSERRSRNWYWLLAAGLIAAAITTILGCGSTPTAAPIVPTLEPSPTPVAVRDPLALGDELVARSKYEEAAEQYRKAVETDGAIAHARLAMALDYQGYLQRDKALLAQAVDEATTATEIAPDSAEAWARLARAYVWSQKYEKAIAAAEKAVRLDDGYADGHAILAEAYLNGQRIEKARAEAQKALDLDPTNAEGHRSLGHIYTSEAEIEAANVEFGKAVAQQPDQALYHYELGARLRTLGEDEQAIAEYEKAIALYPKAALVHRSLGWIYLDQRRYDEAIASFQSALDINADYLNAVWGLGQTYRAASKCEEAIRAYERVIELNPEANVAWANIGWCYYVMGDQERAREAAQRSLEIYPDGQEAQGLLVALGEPTPTPAPTALPPTVPPATPVPVAATATAAPQPATSLPAAGGLIAFPVFDPQRGTYDIFAARPDGSERQRLASAASQPDFNADGTDLVYRSWDQGKMGLFVKKTFGDDVWRISPAPEAARPSISENGTLIYSTREESDRLPRLYQVFGADNARGIRRGADWDVIIGESPAWLPGGRVVYKGCVDAGCGLLILDGAFDGTGFSQITRDTTDTNPEASPDGGQIAFMSHRDGNWEVYVVNSDGSGLARLTTDPANDGLPTWSPDGRTLAFLSDRSGEWAVWAMRPDGSGQRQLFALGGSPDGVVSGATESRGWLEERITWGSQ